MAVESTHVKGLPKNIGDELVRRREKVHPNAANQWENARLGDGSINFCLNVVTL